MHRYFCPKMESVQYGLLEKCRAWHLNWSTSNMQEGDLGWMDESVHPCMRKMLWRILLTYPPEGLPTAVFHLCLFTWKACNDRCTFTLFLKMFAELKQYYVNWWIILAGGNAASALPSYGRMEAWHRGRDNTFQNTGINRFSGIQGIVNKRQMWKNSVQTCRI